LEHSSKLKACAFSRWVYGNSIILDSMLYAARYAPAGGSAAASVAFVDARLDSFARSEGSASWNLTHGVVGKVGFGQVVDVFPFVYLSRAEFHRSASGLAVAAAGAAGVLSWPKRWQGQPSKERRKNPGIYKEERRIARKSGGCARLMGGG